MNNEEIKSIIEAILFVWSEPISSNELGKILSINSDTIDKILGKMIKEFDEERRGIQIIKVNNFYQLSTRPEHHPYIEKLFAPGGKRGLTQAALETLAIIAYNQPVTKPQIENIRGVRCDKAINTLQERNLIEIKGRLDRIGRPILYGTTLTFLKTFGFESIKDLPDIKKFKILTE